jgi:hypothetical protein
MMMTVFIMAFFKRKSYKSIFAFVSAPLPLPGDINGKNFFNLLIPLKTTQMETFAGSTLRRDSASL